MNIAHATISEITSWRERDGKTAVSVPGECCCTAVMTQEYRGGSGRESARDLGAALQRSRVARISAPMEDNVATEAGTGKPTDNRVFVLILQHPQERRGALAEARPPLPRLRGAARRPPVVCARMRSAQS